MGEVLATGKLGIIFGLPDLLRTSVLAGRLTIEMDCWLPSKPSNYFDVFDIFKHLLFSFEENSLEQRPSGVSQLLPGVKISLFWLS